MIVFYNTMLTKRALNQKWTQSQADRQSCWTFSTNTHTHYKPPCWIFFQPQTVCTKNYWDALYTVAYLNLHLIGNIPYSCMCIYSATAILLYCCCTTTFISIVSDFFLSPVARSTAVQALFNRSIEIEIEYAALSLSLGISPYCIDAREVILTHILSHLTDAPRIFSSNAQCSCDF